MSDHEMKKKSYLEKVKDFFEEKSPEIYSFALSNALVVEEFPQRTESWNLGFKHPKGGYGYISVFLLPNDNVAINNLWVLYNFETFTMCSKNKNSIATDVSSDNFKKGLEAALKEILSWDSSGLELVGGKEGSLKETWSKFKSKEAWENSLGNMPKNYPKGYEHLAEGDKR